MTDDAPPRTSRSSLELSPDQAAALEAVQTWWVDRPGEQTFALAGYAGTGKTTIIAELIRIFEDGRLRTGERVQTIVGTPTGKAAARLRQKGVTAATIHSLAYRFANYDADGNPEFDYVGLGGQSDPLDVLETGYDPLLLIIDEASMVNTRMHEDLTRSGYRILYVGDHGQLPPIGGDPRIMREPHFVLETIHRQDDRGLLDFAHRLREGEKLPDAWGAVRSAWTPPGAVRRDRGLGESLRGADVVLCWRNATRHALNHALLQVHGLIAEGTPFVQESKRAVLLSLCRQSEALTDCKAFPVVCLQNNRRLGVFNGEVYTYEAERVRDDVVEGYLHHPELGRRRTRLDLAGFGLQVAGYRCEIPGAALCDFGFALTVHKAQGSEWEHVAVLDDLRMRDPEDSRRWRYTAATRAKEKLLWLHT